MNIVTVLAQKGGTGKTTLSIHLATVASGGGRKVVIADTDPQASAMVWKKRRRKDLPEVLQCGVRDLKREVAAMKASGVELLLVDTPPHSTGEAGLAAAMADMVLAPSRPAILDLAAIGDTTAVIKASGRPGAVVLNCCPPPTRYGESAIVREAREALAVYGLPVAPTALSQRAAFSHALIDGRAVTEFESRGKAAAEINALWNWLQKELGHDE